MKRLWAQLYVALLGATLLCVAVAALAFRAFGPPVGPPAQRLHVAAAVLRDAIPPRGRPQARARAAAALADDLAVDLVVWDADGRALFSAAERPFPAPAPLHQGWTGEGSTLALVLDMGDGRYLGLRNRLHPLRRRADRFVGTLVVLALIMGLGSYPVARRLARRLEALDRGVRRFGGGDLGHRVPVEGGDEVAALAASFNQAAARVDTLVAQQRQMLASASHELRSPLARLRMALELLREEDDGGRRGRQVEAARKDISDLDALIEELLLFARSEAGTARAPERVDLLALAREEAARGEAAVRGEAAAVMGDPLLLRHLVRNLLDNARRHGGGRDVAVSVEPAAGTVVLAVEDRGPGVPESERERIFAPFYRLPGTAGGVGLGLALVRQVARTHGGDARVRARDGGGSRFEVTLPLA